jgi:hypothetical protein
MPAPIRIDIYFGEELFIGNGFGSSPVREGQIGAIKWPSCHSFAASDRASAAQAAPNLQDGIPTSSHRLG